MDIVNVAVIAFIGIVASFIIKQNRPELSFVLIIVCCVLILLSGVSKIFSVFEVLEDIEEIIILDEKYMKYLIKILGISYISGFTSDVCKDAGHNALAGQVDIFGKISILMISLPVVLALIEVVSEVLG